MCRPLRRCWPPFGELPEALAFGPSGRVPPSCSATARVAWASAGAAHDPLLPRVVEASSQPAAPVRGLAGRCPRRGGRGSTSMPVSAHPPRHRSAAAEQTPAPLVAFSARPGPSLMVEAFARPAPPGTSWPGAAPSILPRPPPTGPAASGWPLRGAGLDGLSQSPARTLRPTPFWLKVSAPYRRCVSPATAPQARRT